MSFRQLLQKFGVWTTVMKWNEPRFYRVRLKGDLVPRLAIAGAVGSIATTLLLVLFAINVKPPHPLFAFVGMALVGGMALMFLVCGSATAGGRVRVCQEGICRKRMYVGLSAQWVEEWSWPYSKIPQCAIIQGMSIDKPFSVMLLTDGSEVELVGIPDHVDLNAAAQFLASKGVTVRHDVRLPPQFVRPMNLPISLVAGAIGLVVLVGGIGFYALKVTDRRGNEVAAGKFVEPPANGVQPEDVLGPAMGRRPRRNRADGFAEPVPPADIRPSAAEPAPPAPMVASPAPDNQIAPTAPNVPQLEVVEDKAAPDRAPEPNLLRGPDPSGVAPIDPLSATPQSPRKTELLGGSGGFPFEANTPDQQPTIGFRFGFGSWGGKQAVARLDPVSQRNVAGRSDSLVMAREGFVVGGVQVDAEDLVQAVRVVFVRRNDDGVLDKTDYYFSDWIGEPTGGAVKTLGKGNLAVLGVFGRRGIVIDAIGLVLAEP